MKFVAQLLSLMLVLALVSTKAKHTKSRKNKFNIKNLRTPKGSELNNHFGSDPSSNAYGPAPVLVSHEALIQNGDGSVAKRYIKQIVGGNIEQKQKGCDITQKDWYGACLNIDSCDLCAASEHCAWCEHRATCFPRGLDTANCGDTCINGWVWGAQSCKGTVRRGHLSNWAVDTDHMQTVEYSQPKYRVDTLYTAPQVVRTPVLLGSIVQKSGLTKKNAQTNQLSFIREQESVKPIYGEIHQVLPVDVHSTQYIDTFSGKRVDQWGEQNIQFHGVDDAFQVNNDFKIKREMERPRRMSTWQKQKQLESGSHHV